MAESSIQLAPSRTPREGFGLVAAEAASVGTPCIVSDAGGLPETVKDNVTGFVVSNEDVKALGSRIVQILTDGLLWSRLSARSYEHATESFSLAACIDGYAAAYRRVLGTNRSQTTSRSRHRETISSQAGRRVLLSTCTANVTPGARSRRSIRSSWAGSLYAETM